jgi:hypothetical protein
MSPSSCTLALVPEIEEDHEETEAERRERKAAERKQADALGIERWSNSVVANARSGMRLGDAWIAANREEEDVEGEEDRPWMMPPDEAGPMPGPRALELRVFGPDGELPLKEDWEPWRKARLEADMTRVQRKPKTNGVHHMPDWVAHPTETSDGTRTRTTARIGASAGPADGSKPISRDATMRPVAPERPPCPAESFEEPGDPDGEEAGDVLTRVLAAVVKLGFGTGGMIAYEADLPADKAASALGALQIDGKVQRVVHGGTVRWRVS